VVLALHTIGLSEMCGINDCLIQLSGTAWDQSPPLQRAPVAGVCLVAREGEGHVYVNIYVYVYIYIDMYIYK